MNDQAAHGFITQHKWAKQVKYVLNLEAIGTGGQELVFQCNSGWMANFYAEHAPHPHVSVVAHELFKIFLYRMSSTDWSTLLKYGSPGIRGLDTAYIQNGYVYHTSFDVHSAIPSEFNFFMLLNMFFVIANIHKFLIIVFVQTVRWSILERISCT